MIADYIGPPRQGWQTNKRYYNVQTQYFQGEDKMMVWQSGGLGGHVFLFVVKNDTEFNKLFNKLNIP